jgi:DnaJ-domain-containing protein 1
MTTIFLAKASDGAHAIRLSSRDADTFKLLIEALKDYVPACHRVYVPGRKTWRVDAYAAADLRAWLAYGRGTFNARIEWIGGEAATDPDAEWTPPPSKPRTSDPYTALWLLPGAPPEVVKAAYKALATLHHPDKPGGDGERMRAINSAYQQLAA